MNNEINSKKPDADYCKGWKEGYIKAFSKATGEKISSADVPNCVAQGKCEGYKCGYAAGVRNASSSSKRYWFRRCLEFSYYIRQFRYYFYYS
jgi:hypothetical protein